MAKKLILPTVPSNYDAEIEKIRNREIETVFKFFSQKISELEERIKALEP